MKKALFILLSIIACCNAFAQNNAFSVQTKIESGVIEGNYDTKSQIQTYFGIPFAAPPVGNLRWKAPQPVAPWSGVKQTKKFGPRPMQKLIWEDMASRSEGVSEDCLYLNVWTPAKRNTKNLPVLFYIYGGGFVAGDASEPRYDGEAMAKKGIVVVTANHRLNIFGFFSHPELSAETSYKGSGNYGLLDQVAALNWIKKNISAFGGDPNHITLCGESAGSISVSYLMGSPLSRNSIVAAIGESGAGISALPPSPLKDAEKIGADFAKSFKVNSLAELRKLSSRDLYEMYDESHRFGFPVTVDNYFLPKTLTEIFESKQQAQVPLLAGWNSAESGYQGLMGNNALSSENFVNAVKQRFPAVADELIAQYPHSNESEIMMSATEIASNSFIGYSTWKWLDLHLKNSDQPVYRYYYSKLRAPLAGTTVDPNAKPAIGAPHACEIEYCMGNLDLVKMWAFTPDDHKVSNTMSAYFANFIKTFNPNGDKLPEWKSMRTNDGSTPVMQIDVESKSFNAMHDDRTRLLDKVFAKKS